MEFTLRYHYNEVIHTFRYGLRYCTADIEKDWELSERTGSE